MHIPLTIPDQQLQDEHLRNQPLDFVRLQESAATMLEEFSPQIQSLPEESHQCFFIGHTFRRIRQILTQSSKDGLESVLT
jgi:hypothetical protein